MLQQSRTGASYSLPLTEQARRQLDAYWQQRITQAVDSLEREARRMLQLEAQLSTFAQEYYEAVGPWAECLAGLEASAAASEEIAPLPLALAQCEHREARNAELKSRYRQIALEIHPDRAMIVEGGGNAQHMQAANDAYAKGDLAALLRCEAELLLARFAGDWKQAEPALRDIERAASTYAAAYRTLLNAPLNHLMLRAMAAHAEGWDFITAVIGRIERAIASREETSAEAVVAA